MIAIIYLSESNIEFTENDLKSLASLSASRNKKAIITGYLTYQHDRFIQYIEGEKSKVLDLMKSIEKDNRHLVMYKLQKDIEEDRFFPSWSMRLIKKEELDEFQLKTLIEQNFILIKKGFPNKDCYEKIICNHVNALRTKYLYYCQGFFFPYTALFISQVATAIFLLHALSRKK